jgi:ABC-2 type transport system permease protein
MKKIYYLWLRQIKIYLRSRARIIGTVAQPIIFLIMFGYGFGGSFGGGGGNYLSFLAPGIVGMSILFTSIFTGIEVIWDRQFGFLKETLVAPMPRTDVMIGRTVGGATVATIQGIIVLFVSMIFGFRPANWSALIPVIFIMFLVALIFSSIGTVIGSMLNDMQAFQLIMNFLVQPLFFLSGALFKLQGLPDWLTFISRIDPLTYAIDGFRVLLSNIGHHDLSLGHDVLFLIVMAAFFLLVGGRSFDRIQI